MHVVLILNPLKKHKSNRKRKEGREKRKDVFSLVVVVKTNPVEHISVVILAKKFIWNKPNKLWPTQYKELSIP